MTTKERAAPVAAGATTIIPTTDSIPEQATKHNNPLRRVLELSGAEMQALVGIVQEKHPGFTTLLAGRCMNTEHYGIELCAQAMERVKDTLLPGWRMKEHTREKPCRAYVRMTVEDYTDFLLMLKDKGYGSAQAFFHDALQRQLKAWRKSHV